MKKILVVSPREEINYKLVFPAVIRALDHFKDETEPVRYMIDNVSGGTSSLVMEAVNKMEASLLARGYDVKASLRRIDVMAHGKAALKEWTKRLLPEADLILIFDVGPSSAAKEAREYAEENNIDLLEINAEVLEKKKPVLR